MYYPTLRESSDAWYGESLKDLKKIRQVFHSVLVTNVIGRLS